MNDEREGCEENPQITQIPQNDVWQAVSSAPHRSLLIGQHSVFNTQSLSFVTFYPFLFSLCAFRAPGYFLQAAIAASKSSVAWPGLGLARTLIRKR